MKNTDPRVDAYIDKAQAFAQPILQHIRQLVHKAYPNVEETVKWKFPHFVNNGSTLCYMASFKEHCTFGFFKAKIMKDPENILVETRGEAMGHFGRITGLEDLPSDKIMMAYIKEAAKLNEDNIKLPAKAKNAVEEMAVPEILASALAANKAADKVFKSFPPGKRKDYIVWINEAKTETTREKRTQQAVEWIAEGKGKNWKYEKC